jgi:hypothetical protein
MSSPRPPARWVLLAAVWIVGVAIWVLYLVLVGWVLLRFV